MLRRTPIPFTCVLLAATVAHAQAAPDSWNRVVGLNRGDSVRITTVAGGSVFRSSAIDGNHIGIHASIGRFITPIISIGGEIIGPVTVDVTREGAGSVNVVGPQKLPESEVRRLTALGFHERTRSLGPGASVLLGVHPWPAGRVRVGFFGGFSLRPTKYSELTEAPTVLASGDVELRRWQFTSASTSMFPTFGIDVRIGVTERLAVVPQARLDVDNRWTAFRPAIGVQYAF